MSGATPGEGRVRLLVPSPRGPAWLRSPVALGKATAADGKAGSPGAARDAALQVMLSDALDIVAAGFAILVVLKLTRMQDRKAHEGPVAFGA